VNHRQRSYPSEVNLERFFYEDVSRTLAAGMGISQLTKSANEPFTYCSIAHRDVGVVFRNVDLSLEEKMCVVYSMNARGHVLALSEIE
jgi:hypothetical protein